jgi:hypothetical protein
VISREDVLEKYEDVLEKYKEREAATLGISVPTLPRLAETPLCEWDPNNTLSFSIAYNHLMHPSSAKPPIFPFH